MASHHDGPALGAASLANGNHSNGACTDGDYHSSRKIDSILSVDGTGIVDSHGNAVVLKGVSACVSWWETY